MEPGEFCVLFGVSIRNQVLETFLESASIDLAGVDIAEFLDISKPSVYAAIKELEEQDFIKKTRVIGRTQLYTLNRDNPRIVLMLKIMDDMIDYILDEQTQKYSLQKQKVVVAERRKKYKK